MNKSKLIKAVTGVIGVGALGTGAIVATSCGVDFKSKYYWTSSDRGVIDIFHNSASLTTKCNNATLGTTVSYMIAGEYPEPVATISGNVITRASNVESDTELQIDTYNDGKKVGDGCKITVLKTPANPEAPAISAVTNGWLQLGQTFNAVITVYPYNGATLDELELPVYSGLTFDGEWTSNGGGSKSINARIGTITSEINCTIPIICGDLSTTATVVVLPEAATVPTIRLEISGCLKIGSPAGFDKAIIIANGVNGADLTTLSTPSNDYINFGGWTSSGATQYKNEITIADNTLITAGSKPITVTGAGFSAITYLTVLSADLEPGIYASSSDHLLSGSTAETATITVNGNAMIPAFTDGDLAIPVKTGFAFDPTGWDYSNSQQPKITVSLEASGYNIGTNNITIEFVGGTAEPITTAVVNIPVFPAVTPHVITAEVHGALQIGDQSAGNVATITVTPFGGANLTTLELPTYNDLSFSNWIDAGEGKRRTTVSISGQFLTTGNKQIIIEGTDFITTVNLAVLPPNPVKTIAVSISGILQIGNITDMASALLTVTAYNGASLVSANLGISSSNADAFTFGLWSGTDSDTTRTCTITLSASPVLGPSRITVTANDDNLTASDFVQTIAAAVVPTNLIITNTPTDLYYTQNAAGNYTFNTVDNLGGAVSQPTWTFSTTPVTDTFSFSGNTLNWTGNLMGDFNITVYADVESLARATATIHFHASQIPGVNVIPYGALDISGTSLIRIKSTYTTTPNSTLVVPSGITSISAEAFKNQTNISQLIFTNTNPITIGTSAFEGCTNIRQIECKGNKTFGSIEQAAFKSCLNLEGFGTSSIVINNIGTGAFYGCKNLTYEGIANISSINDCTRMAQTNYVYFKKSAQVTFNDSGCLAFGAIPSGIFNTETPPGAYEGCAAITSVDTGPLPFASSGPNLGYYFANCTNLRSHLRTGYTQTASIAVQAYYNCPNLNYLESAQFLSSTPGANAFTNTGIYGGSIKGTNASALLTTLRGIYPQFARWSVV